MIMSDLTLGSTYTFKLSVTKDGVIWNLVGATVNLILANPSGIKTTIPAGGPYNGGASANWTAAGLTGEWLRAWDVTDAGGVRVISDPIGFNVISSPI